MSIFTSSKNTFEGKFPEEKVLLVTRKHWLGLFGPLAIMIVAVGLPFVVYLMINSFSWYPKISSLYWFLTAVALLILWNLAFYHIMIYSLNTFIVTDKRIIENEQIGLFKHTVDEIEIEDIQDISVKIHGFFPQILGYGDIEVQSSGAVNKFFFNELPRPRKIKNILMDIKLKTD